jgi:hypothetical protein
MAHSQWCGKKCSECETSCSVDEDMGCSPDCEAINPKTNLHDIEICINCGADLKEITQEEAEQIIETREPLGQFFKIENDLYIGIDNQTGNAWTEEFKSREDCFRWLYGEELE